MNNALLYIGGLLVFVLAALVAVPHFVDWNSYRGVFEEEASRVLGRDVRIGGAVNLRLLPSPYIRLEKLKIADPSSNTGDSLFRAESFTLWLSVPPLLKGVFEANKIEVRRPVVQLVASPDGGGNWQSLSFDAGRMPLVPQGVSLQSVSIVDGVLVMGTTIRHEIARFQSINGDLTAETLSGPYKFSGTLSAGGDTRDVRLATSAVEANQEMRFKATVRTPSPGDTLGSLVTVTGSASDLRGRVKIDGDMTAELNVTLLCPQYCVTGLPKSDVTAKISADATGFEFKDIVIALQKSATPQLISGAAKVSWPQRTQIEVALASRWLDFDQLTGVGKVIPIDIARHLFDALASNLPDEADTSTKVVLDQVTLGGDAVSDVRFEASRAGGALELKGVRASLPGGVRIGFDGQMSGKDVSRAFAGTISLHGQSLQRFTTWGAGNEGLLNARANGPFALEGELAVSRDAIHITNASAEIASVPLSGEFNATFDGRRKISIVVEGDRIDAGAIWPGSLSADFVAGLLRAPGGAAATPDAAPAIATSPDPLFKASAADTDVRVRLHAAELADGPRILKNVDADLAIENGALAMPRLKFTTADGIVVELEGETKSSAGVAAGQTAQTAHTGQVRGTVTALDGAAIVSLARALDLGAAAEVSPQSLAALVPLRLAGRVNFGARTAQSTDIQVDGSAGAARIAGAILLDGGWSTWRTSPSDITLMADSPDIVGSAVALLGGSAKFASQDAAADAARAGRVHIKAVAGLAGGFQANATLRSDGLVAAYDGTIQFAKDDGWVTDGDVRVKSDDARAALALAGLRIGKGVGATALTGSIKTASAKGARTFAFEGLQAGNSKVSGRIALNPIANAAKDDPAMSFEADLVADSMSIPAVLGMLTNDTAATYYAPVAAEPATNEKSASPVKKRRAQIQVPLPPPVDTEPSVWPVQSFDAGLLTNLSGKVKATLGSLSIEPGVGLGDVILEAAITPHKIDLTRIEGKALGGAATSTLTFDKDPVGFKLTGSLAIKAGGESASNAALKVDFSGRGGSPAGLIADLKGKGELALADGAINVNSPAALADIAEAALLGRGPASGEDLALAVHAAMAGHSQPLGGFSIPVSMGDGILRLDKVKIESAAGRTQFNASIELDRLNIESEWQVEPKIKRSLSSPDRVLIAPVAILYKGKLNSLTNMEPEIAIANFERELAVRKMERDVEELERLRALDQAQAAAEQERRKAIEAERLKAAAAAKAARDAAAAAAAAAQLPVPAPGTSGDGAAPEAVPGSGVPALNERSNGATSITPGQPSPTAQGYDDIAGEELTEQPGKMNVGARPRTARSAAARPRPIVRKKPVQNSANPPWKPFQVTPY